MTKGVDTGTKTSFMLDENDMPTTWYNIQPDLPTPLQPYLDAQGNPASPDDLAAIFPPDCIE